MAEEGKEIIWALKKISPTVGVDGHISVVEAMLIIWRICTSVSRRKADS